MHVRAHLRFVAMMWLTCQVAAFAASPLVLCHDHGGMRQTAAGHECGRSCPLHHHAQPPSTAASAEHEHHAHHSPHATTTSSAPAEGARLDCQCTISDAALAALMLDAGVLPGAFVLDTSVASSRVVLPDYATPTRTQPIDTPPPRA